MADLLRLFKRSQNQPIALRILLALALISSLIVTGSSPASAVPGAPTITSITSSGTSGPINVTVNFSRADGSAPQPAGYIYSTDTGTTWSLCDSPTNSDCGWNLGSNSILIKKKSNENARLQAPTTYEVLIAECSSTKSGVSSSTDIALLKLGNCGALSIQVSYVGGSSYSTGTPVIESTSTIANASTNPSITITSSQFETNTSYSLFEIDYGTTGLDSGTVTFNSASNITFVFTGTASFGTIKITAKTTAFAPGTSAASNTLEIEVPATLPETPTAISAGSATSSSLLVSWTAPSNNGGAAISDYWLQYSSNSGSTWETFTASASATASRTVSGLAASTSYIFRVAAKNSVGYGPFSDSSTAVSTSATYAPAPAPAPAPEVIPAPIITKVSKTLVCARGGDEILIQGSYLANATITIDGKAVQGRGNSSNSVLITLEEATSGTKVLTLTTPSGTASTTLTYKLVDRTAFKVFDIPYIYKGGEFSYIFEAFGENTFRVTGKFPAGLTLNAATGEISGIPTEEGVFNFVLHADGVCGNDVDVIRLDIDKEIPNAMSCQIKFPNKKTNKIGASQLFALKKCLDQAKKISPKQIDPVIIITGGAPEGEAEIDSEEAKARRDAICDVLLTQDILAQTIAGIFSGEPDVIEIFVYWPVPR